MQGTQVRSLVREDHTGCGGATKLVCHSYWSLHAPEPVLHKKRVAPTLQLEKAQVQRQRPSTAINQYFLKNSIHKKQMKSWISLCDIGTGMWEKEIMDVSIMRTLLIIKRNKRSPVSHISFAQKTLSDFPWEEFDSADIEHQPCQLLRSSVQNECDPGSCPRQHLI